MFGGNFAPNGWALCAGQLLPIDQNTALFSLLGTTYGGDGVQTFALPNLQSRFPVHQGQGPGLTNRVIGELAGVENVTLISSQMPQHTHVPNCNTSTGNQASPQNNFWAATAGAVKVDSSNAPNTTLNAQAVGLAGGNQPHNNI